MPATATQDIYFLNTSKQYRKRHHSDSSDDDASSPKSSSPSIDDDRRAHHNELERKRRDHIKDHFVILKEAIPLLDGEKSSRALILKRAVEYITVMQTRCAEFDKNMHLAQKRNEMLEEKLLELTAAANSSKVAPVPTVQFPQVQVPMPQIAPFPANTNPLALAAMDPAQLSSLVASSQEAIIALTQSLIGMQSISPMLQQSPSVSPPAFYPTTFSPNNSQKF